MSIQTPLALQSSTTALTIRLAEGRDFACLMDMIRVVEPLTEDRLNLDELGLIDVLHAPNPWIRLLVAEVNGIVIGYVALVGGLQINPAERTMEMHHIYVEPDHRRQGVGRALSSSAMATARALGCETLSVAVARTTDGAKAAYRALGFEKPASNKTHYVIPV
ncbi:GNAT family N-acetyltransferase [Celeribacter sp. ULVN23_4]